MKQQANKKNYKIFIVLALIAVLAMLPASCGSKDFPGRKPPVSDPKNPGNLTSFNYYFGSFHEGYWEYEVYENNGDAYFLAHGANEADLYVTTRVDMSVLEDITKILIEKNVFDWDGFKGGDYEIMDGYGFGLRAVFGNRELIAEGYMKYPKNYGAGHNALAEYLEKLTEVREAPEIADKSEITYLTVYWGVDLDTNVSVGLYETESETVAIIHYRHDGINENYTKDDVEEYKLDRLIGFVFDYYREHKDDEGPEASGGGGGRERAYVAIRVNSEGFGREIDCGFSLDGRRDKEDYEILKELALDLVRIPENTPGTKEYQLAEYKKRFNYTKVFLYDESGLGKVVVDMPGQSATINGEERKTSQESMLGLHKEMSNGLVFADFKFHEHKNQKQKRGLEEGEIAEDVFDSLIGDGCTWVLGYVVKEDVVNFYGGTGGTPDEWDDIVRLVWGAL